MNSELKAPQSVPDLMRAIGAGARAAELVLRTFLEIYVIVSSSIPSR